jgi:hypothetical protein
MQDPTNSLRPKPKLLNKIKEKEKKRVIEHNSRHLVLVQISADPHHLLCGTN